MKIYFAGSIRGGRQDKDLYVQIIPLLEKFGIVLTEHIGNSGLTNIGEDLPSGFIYSRDMGWLKESDVVVAEVTQPSLGVGYELASAENMGKKVLCIYRKNGSLSAMIDGNKNLLKKSYTTVSDLNTIFKEFFSSI